jgi:prepilin-type N-terminal cleavage/methylation domain-containing protein
MTQDAKERARDEQARGFTLIELMVVIIVGPV